MSEQNPYAPPSAGSSAEDAAVRGVGGPEGIRGWLLVFFILMCAGTVWRVLQVFPTSSDRARLISMAPPGSVLDTAIVINLVGRTVLLGFSLLILYQFLRKSRRTAVLIIWRELATVALVAVHTLLLGQALGPASWMWGAAGAVLTEAALAGIWIAYFLKSRRVKNTFTR